MLYCFSSPSSKDKSMSNLCILNLGHLFPGTSCRKRGQHIITEKGQKSVLFLKHGLHFLTFLLHWKLAHAGYAMGFVTMGYKEAEEESSCFS